MAHWQPLSFTSTPYSWGSEVESDAAQMVSMVKEFSLELGFSESNTSHLSKWKTLLSVYPVVPSLLCVRIKCVALSWLRKYWWGINYAQVFNHCEFAHVHMCYQRRPCRNDNHIHGSYAGLLKGSGCSYTVHTCFLRPDTAVMWLASSPAAPPLH